MHPESEKRQDDSENAASVRFRTEECEKASRIIEGCASKGKL
jgi:hypothetical protein